MFFDFNIKLRCVLLTTKNAKEAEEKTSSEN